MALAPGSKCPECGAEIKALGTTTFCPREAQHRRSVPRVDVGGRCPKCMSIDVAPFALPMYVAPLLHCIDCGHVYRK